MSADLPEPRVSPTPTFSPRMNLVMAATLALGVMGLVMGLGNPPSQAGPAASVQLVDAGH